MNGPIFLLAATDPFAQYPGMETQADKGKGGGSGGGGGKGNPHNPVPEPDATGVFLIGTALILVLAIRFINRWRPA